MQIEDYMLHPIGRVRSAVADRKSMPPMGGPAAVELFPQFEAGLLKLEKHSHFWILGWLMGRPERDVLQVTPRGVEPNPPESLHGVFAVRSPARPNPIGLTAARLVRREGLLLTFDRLDFLDGTPVLDLKPYFVSRDMVFSATNRAVGRPRSREALRESLLLQVANFHPVSHPDVELAVRLMERFRVDDMGWVEPEEWDITAPATRPHLVSALMGMTRVSPGRGLSFGQDEAVWINGRRYDL